MRVYYFKGHAEWVIGFADIIGLTIVERLLDEIEIFTNKTVYNIKSWLGHTGLPLADHKTKVIPLIKRRKSTPRKIKIETQK